MSGATPPRSRGWPKKKAIQEAAAQEAGPRSLGRSRRTRQGAGWTDRRDPARERGRERGRVQQGPEPLIPVPSHEIFCVVFKASSIAGTRCRQHGLRAPHGPGPCALASAFLPLLRQKRCLCGVAGQPRRPFSACIRASARLLFLGGPSSDKEPPLNSADRVVARRLGSENAAVCQRSELLQTPSLCCLKFIRLLLRQKLC
jgi:hypothetical protein